MQSYISGRVSVNQMSDFDSSQNGYSYGEYNNGGYTYHAEDTGLLDARTYNLAMTACLFWGFLVNFVICRFFTDFFYNMNPFVFLIGYFVCAFAGIRIVKKADKALPAFLGYNLLALPIGGVLSVFLVGYSTTVVQYAFLATALVTLIMGVMSYIYPQAFLSMGKALGISLIAVIIVELIMTLIFRSSITVIDYVVALIFSLYIGYDLARSQRKAFTYVNAIDCAAELYLDIINLFMRIVSIMGRSSRD